MLNRKNNQNGFAALYIILLVMTFVFAVAISISTLSYGEQRIVGNITKSSQAYYAAEAGIEDALLRLSKNPQWSEGSDTSYPLEADGATTTVTVTKIIGGSRIITSTGDISNQIRKIRVVYQISSETVSFHYGAQVGDGGLLMGSGSEVKGNVFSNGNVVGAGTIDNSIIVANSSNKIENVHVKENATVHTCKDSTVDGNLTYVSGGSVQNCTVGGATSTRPNQIDSQPLPIPQSQIDGWKNEAAAGGVTTTDVAISGIVTLGPIQIGTSSQPRNLSVGNGDTLKLNGTIYVTGNITFNQNSKVQLESCYGPLSGIIIADGTIMVENGTIMNGSGEAGSYILISSTKSDIVTPVIDVKNNAMGAIFYANSGLIYLKNNMTAREVTGYKVQLENNAVIQYESGLADASFSTGPGGSWKVASWREIE